MNARSHMLTVGARVATTVAVACLAGIAIWAGETSAPSRPHMHSAAAATSGTDSTHPSWVPQGAAAPVDRVSSQYGVTRDTSVISLPASSQDLADNIVVEFQPGVAALPPSVADPAYFKVTDVTVGGFTGQLTEPDSGYGPVYVQWIDPNGFHGVFCPRFSTSAGATGLSDDELVRVANSLYN